MIVTQWTRAHALDNALQIYAEPEDIGEWLNEFLDAINVQAKEYGERAIVYAREIAEAYPVEKWEVPICCTEATTIQNPVCQTIAPEELHHYVSPEELPALMDLAKRGAIFVQHIDCVVETLYEGQEDVFRAAGYLGEE